MKLLLTTPSLNDQGGVANYINSVLPYLRKGNAIHNLEIGSTQRKKGIFHPIADQVDFHRLISSSQFDLCHVNPSLNLKSFFRDGMLIWQAKQAGLPVIVFFHGWRKDFENKISRHFLYFFRKTFCQADAFIVLASDFKRVLQKWGVKQPIFLGTTAVDETLLDNFSIEEKTRQTREAEKIKILFLSRLEREKGIFETVDAVYLLLKKKLPVILSIAGEGSAMDALEDYINKKRFAANTIHLLGYVNGPAKQTAFVDNHLYCLPTYGEGLPISLLEAMSFGMPVITRPVGGIADFFEEGKMGYLCKSNNPEELAQLLEKLLNDREKLLEIGRYNHEYAKKNFMASRVAEKLVHIYERVLNLSGDNVDHC